MSSAVVALLSLWFAVALVRVRAQGSTSGCCEESCYTKDDQSQNLRFSTKTAYEFVKGRQSDLQTVPHCEPLQFWLLSRHGTRLPAKKEIMRMPRLEQLRDQVLGNYEDRSATLPDTGRLCFEDLDNLSRWKWDRSITPDREQFLVNQGSEDLRLLARRYQSKYPALMDSQYDPRLYEFRHTDTQRTEHSFKAFAEGLFGPSSANIHLPPPPRNDTLLKVYDSCPRWRFEHELPNAEYLAFRNSSVYQRLLADVSTKLGFRYPLDQDTVQDVWNMCRYDRAWKLDRLGAPWCAAFTRSQVKILEYLEDLKYYYSTGYGHDINAQVGCPPLKDMMEKFTRKIDKNEGPNVVAYFTHQATLNMLLVSMGLAKDTKPLRARDFPDNEDREWRTSKQSPFTGNLAAVLHRCDDTERDRYQVLFLLNEAPANVPGCRVGLCSWDTVRQKYALVADHCSPLSGGVCDSNTAASYDVRVWLIVGCVIALIARAL